MDTCAIASANLTTAGTFQRTAAALSWRPSSNHSMFVACGGEKNGLSFRQTTSASPSISGGSVCFVSSPSSGCSCSLSASTEPGRVRSRSRLLTRVSSLSIGACCRQFGVQGEGRARRHRSNCAAALWSREEENLTRGVSEHRLFRSLHTRLTRGRDREEEQQEKERAGYGRVWRRRRCSWLRASPVRGENSKGRRTMGASSITKANLETGMPVDPAIPGSAPFLDDVPHLSSWLPNLPTYPNPLNADPAYRAVKSWFIEENEVVAREVVVRLSSTGSASTTFFRRAGPRERVAFKPEEVVAGIVTCGGLCPGLNTVVRELVCVLWTQYGVRNILGIEGGYRGFYARNTIPLTPKVVNDIHKRGGTILGTSRGGHEVVKIVNSIEDRGMNQVYIIGGDGTQRGADVIHREIVRRGLKVAVAGIPKTIDNDIAVIDRSFGFDTAVEEAQRAIDAAHVEAQSVASGVGVVKLMGRYSGYIAMHATLASRDVDCCLIPELPFYLEGKGGLYEFVENRLLENGHMVIVVAEGAGQELIAKSVDQVDAKSDESGNRLLLDVGMWLSSQLKNHWEKNRKGPLNIKYIDPTYMVRAVPSNASDSVYCTLLAHSAVHGAMAGFTGFVAGPVNGRHAYIPIARVTEKQNRVNVHDRMWARLLSSTNQPDFMRYKQILDEKRRLRECEADRLERCLEAAAAAAIEATSTDKQKQTAEGGSVAAAAAAAAAGVQVSKGGDVGVGGGGGSSSSSSSSSKSQKSGSSDTGNGSGNGKPKIQSQGQSGNGNGVSRGRAEKKKSGD